MILSAKKIADLIENPEDSRDPLVITPKPDLEELRRSGDASIDIRLGCWFSVLKHAHVPMLDIGAKVWEDLDETALTKTHYIPFDKHLVLHPGGFALGVTLEWIRLPKDIGGYVTSRSSWGRRGLIIATATGVHPRFTGCLTLELSNVGEVPIALYPGMAISQFFMHRVEDTASDYVSSDKAGRRKPFLGTIEWEKDKIAKALIRRKRIITEYLD